MTHTLKQFLVCMVGFMILDGIWLGVVMKSFYRDQLAPIARMADGGLAPNWPAAFFVYVALGLGITVFVMPRATDAISAATTGALFGLVVYGVYDLTNFATLAQYPLAVMFVDMAWGSVATAICAVAAHAIVGQG
jgi:uncharacterized membrane protein